MASTGLLNDNFRAELYNEQMSSFHKIIDRPVAALSVDLANQQHEDRVPFFFRGGLFSY